MRGFRRGQCVFSVYSYLVPSVRLWGKPATRLLGKALVLLGAVAGIPKGDLPLGVFLVSLRDALQTSPWRSAAGGLRQRAGCLSLLVASKREGELPPLPQTPWMALSRDRWVPIVRSLEVRPHPKAFWVLLRFKRTARGSASPCASRRSRNSSARQRRAICCLLRLPRGLSLRGLPFSRGLGQQPTNFRTRTSAAQRTQGRREQTGR